MSEKLEKNDDIDIEIEIVDDTPEADRGRAVAPEKTDSDDDIQISDDEVGTYSKGVQKRIKDLTHKAHSERRAKELAGREKDEAVRLAQALFEENNRLKRAGVSSEQALVGQAKVRTEVQIDSIKKSAKEAFEAGETEKFLEAQEQLHRLVSEHEKYVNYVPPQIPQQPAQLPQQPTVKVDPKAEDWYKDNQWFDSPGELEEDMTAYAFAVSDKLIHKRKIDPRSDEYYKEIDRSVRSRFPEYFRSEATVVDKEPTPQSNRPAPVSSVVAPVTRTSRNTNRVVLTSSQVRLAKRFGLSPEQYAAQYVKDYGHG
jgi:hypothetical protein